uniref:AAA+ ATPase domain-containing protein n=1 Tax=Tetranychus urticae TaxID=32264 RepID=T1JVY2_TETUR
MASLSFGKLVCIPIRSSPLSVCQRCRPLLSQLLIRNYMSSNVQNQLLKQSYLPMQQLLVNWRTIKVKCVGNHIIISNYSTSNGDKKEERSPLDRQSRSNSSDSTKDKDANKEKDPEKEKEDPEKNKKDDQKVYMFAHSVLSMFLIGYLLYAMQSDPQGEVNMGFISWNEFYHLMLSTGEVKQLTIRPDRNMVIVQLHDGAIIQGKRPYLRTFFLNVADIESFERKLRKAEEDLGISSENGVPVFYERGGDNSYITLLLLIMLALYALSLTQVRSSVSSSSNVFSKLGRARFTVVDSLTGAGKGVKFADVAGLKEAKIEIMEFVDYLKAPEKFKALGAKVPRGVLLLGPPGCGKTMLAKAVASEANVPFLAMAGTEFIEMIGGLGASRVRDLFKEARKRAPCIVYIDEIDAIGRKRSGTRVETSGEEEQTLNQLLVEMDGMAGREGVILLGSTNRAEVLDKALLRPGRFDRHILIDLPTLEERKETFEKYLKNIKLSIKPENVSSRLASLTPGFSGADIANVCNESALNAARYKRKAVTPNDLEYAVERVIGGIEKKSQALSPGEKKVVAYHECGHALTGWLLKHTDALLKVTIVPRTNNVLGFAQYLPSEQQLYSKEELFDKMCMALGGRVAESVIFNRISSGAQDDLKKVTKMAYGMIKQYGMDDVVGPLSFASEDGDDSFSKKPYSKKLGNIIDNQARMLVAQAYKATEKILLENKDKLKKLSEELLEREVLNYNDIEKLIGPPPHGAKKMIQSLDLSAYENSESQENQESSPNEIISNDENRPNNSKPSDRV